MSWGKAPKALFQKNKGIKKMKKLLLTTALVAASATSVVADGSNFNAGVYGGVALGASKQDAHSINIVPGFNKSTNLGGVGGTIGLNFAYDYIMESGLMLGADIFGAWHSYDAKTDNKSGPISLNHKEKMKYSFGVAGKFGRLFNKTLVYARVGYINTRFEHAVTSNVTGLEDKTSKKNISGLLLGLGVDVPVNEKIALGVSYDFAMYKKQTLSQDAGAGRSQEASFKPRMHFMNVALKYNF